MACGNMEQMLQACLPSVLILFLPLLIFSHFQDEKQDISLLWPKPLISCDVAAANFLVYSVGHTKVHQI